MKRPSQNKDIIKSFLIAFTPESLLMHFQAISCHPSNQKYIHRIEYLMGELLSIPAGEFGTTPVSREEIKSFIESTKEELDKSFKEWEDFEGFNQNNLIPIFWNRSRYYFFYSLYERPYESWMEIIDSLNGPALEDVPTFDEIRKDLIRSLEWQTFLLETISSFSESKEDHETLFVPSQFYLDTVCPMFISEHSEVKTITLGQLRNTGRANLLKYAFQMGKFLPDFNVTIGEQQFIIYPQVHLQILVKKAIDIVTRNTNNVASFMENFRYHLAQATRAMFKKQNEVFALLPQKYKGDYLKGNADFGFWIDKNKLILFKAVTFRHGKDINKELNNLILGVEAMLKDIAKQDTIGIFRGRNEHMLGLIVENLEIQIVLVYQPFDLSFALYLKDNSAWENCHLFSMMDLRAILNNLTSPMEFLKFLGEEKYLRENATLVKNSEFQDRFIWFLQNNHSYITIGAETEKVVSYFPEHRWSLTHAEKTFRHFIAFYDIYYEVERKFPRTFSHIEKYRNNVYRLTDPINFDTSYLSKLSDRFVWVYLPTDPMTLKSNEFLSGAAMFGPMFSDYIARLDTSLIELLNSQGIVDFDLLICPTNFLLRDKEHFPFLQEHLEEISEEKPYKFVTLPVGKRHVRTYFIFEFENSHSIFNTEQNEGERRLLHDFLDSLAFLISPRSKERENLLESIVDNVAPINKKAYAVDRLTLDNPDIKNYLSPLKPTKTDESVARRTVAQFIRKSGYAPGIFKGEPAKELLQKVYDHLQVLIEKEIAKYDESFIVVACQQLELNEGKIEHRKITAGMRATRQLDYSALDSLKTGMQKDSWVGSAIRLLIHTSLKAGMNGKRAPTDSDWMHLLGLAIETLIVATNREFIANNLLEIEIHIDDRFGVRIEDHDLEVDFESFSHKDAEKKMSYAVKAFRNASDPESQNENGDELDSKWISYKGDKIDSLLLAEYGVTFTNIFLVLYILTKVELPHPAAFPVHVMQRNILVQLIRANIVVDIELSDIDKAISFLSLREGIFSKDKFLYFGAMMRNRERITVCPLIELRDGSILFGREFVDASMRIWEETYQGNLPYILKENSELNLFMKEIKNRKAKWLEKKAEEKAVLALSRKYVELNIDNFKRISPLFEKKPSCGEIDLLCVSKESKTVFVFDCKNLVRLHGLYQAKRNIQQFFTSKDSHYKALIRKKKFVSENIEAVLTHFDISESTGWKVKEGFIVNNIHFAAFYENAKVDFVDVESLEEYLTAIELSESVTK